MKWPSLIAFSLSLGISVAFARGQTFQGAWTEVGPIGYTGIPTLGANEPMSGQVSALAVDLNRDPTGNLVYVGSSSGGLWRSTDGLCASPPHPHCTNPTFVPISDQSLPLSVGAIALDPRSNPATIYVGSGAPDNSSNISSYTGEGILVSRDAGKSWTIVGSADNGAHRFAGLGFSSILVDPQNTSILLAATGIGADPNHPFYSVPQGDSGFQNLGIYRSIDSGRTWSRVMAADYGTQPSICYKTQPPTPTFPSGFFHIDLIYDPTVGNYYAAITGVGLFVSTDQGAHWQPLSDLQLGNGLPPGNQMYRISLATRAGVLWAFILLDPCVTPPASAFALYQSTNHAGTWTPIIDPEPPPPAPPPIKPPKANQDTLAKGDLMYVAAPPGANSLLIGTQVIYGKQRVNNRAFPWVWIQNNLHGDEHAIAFVNATTWYVGDDGGAYVTTNQGRSWTSLNTDLRTLEYFSADADSAGSPFFAGGMQDTGPATTSVNPAWSQLVTGDGTYVAPDPQNSKAFYMSENFGDLFYVPTTSSKYPPLVSLNSVSLLAPFEVLPKDAKLQTGLSGAALDIARNGSTLLAGSNSPWLIAFDPAAPSNPCQGPQPTPPPPCNSDITSNPQVALLTTALNTPINYIASVPSDPTTAYLSMGSELYSMSNISFAKHVSLRKITTGPVNGTTLLGHLAVSFTQPQTLYLIEIGFVDGQKIFKTTDGGKSDKNWINISGNLPNAPLNWIALDPLNPNFVYVGSNIGVFVALDGGVVHEQWHSLGTGFPHVPVTQLKIVPGPKLLAATFGRGVWMLTERYTAVAIDIETGNDDARSDTELWATIPGEPTLCLKPSNNAKPDGVCDNNNGGSAPDWNNWTSHGQVFKLKTPSTLDDATITITLYDHPNRAQRICARR
jgi:photosystem II stability/assembly factor-like uncharacterized protein